MFEVYKDFYENIKVIKCFGNYRKDNTKEFEFLDGSQITLKPKTIYCVRDYTCIKNPEIMVLSE